MAEKDRGRRLFQSPCPPRIEKSGESEPVGHSMPEMSVIIVNWNGKHFLETCLTALLRQTFQDFETILVDNASNDESSEYVGSHFPEVNLIALGENRFFTAGTIAEHQHARS